MTSLTLGSRVDATQLGVLVERLPIGVLIFEKERKEVVFANAAARRLLKPTAIRVGAPMPEPWPSYSLRRYAAKLVKASVAPHEHVQLEDRRVYEVSGIGLGRTDHAAILIEDVSERERRTRAESEFVANAAHELLTPLTGIVGAAHVLEAGAKEIPEDRDRFITHIAHECARLSRIARSLLVLARAQSGEEPPRLEILEARKLLEETLAEIEVPVTVRCEETITIFADADLFLQAVSNLLSNAARHGSGDEIVVEAREVGQNLVEIDVGGTAPPPGDEPDFHERFRTAAGRDGGGFGLGLSIAAQSLDVMGGRLLLGPGGARIQLPRGRLST